MAAPPPSTGPGYSYVEESSFEDDEDELLAMGGDPFFLQQHAGGDEEQAGEPNNLQAENGDEKTEKKWVWDGVVDEEAHLDLY
jgi:hypothetical protein